MPIWLSFAIILVMTFFSKYLRTLAFGRSDSVALELCICCFLYCLMSSLFAAQDLTVFLHNDLMRCIVLLFFAFVVAALHKYNKDLCMAQVDQIVRERKTVLKYSGRQRELDAAQGVEDAVLDNVGLLARASVDVWYSQFMDKLFYRILKRTDKSDIKRSFRKKKTLVRWAFADLINSLGIEVRDDSDPNDPGTLDDKSFNISNKKQIISMVVFDSMELLSLLVALRIV